MVLAAQFESFVQPIIIMLVLPLSVPFALFTIWATGRTLNLWSALGILLLFGIVKKNSILQVDYTNVLRARGLPMREAIDEACRTRLRPILMTTCAIIAGLMPTALGLGIGGAQRSAIAVTIIGGQSLCLFLTLLLVPVAYVKFDALEQSVANQQLLAWLRRLRPSFSDRQTKKPDSPQGVFHASPVYHRRWPARGRHIAALCAAIIQRSIQSSEGSEGRRGRRLGLPVRRRHRAEAVHSPPGRTSR